MAARLIDSDRVHAFAEALGPRVTWTAVMQGRFADEDDRVWQQDAAGKIRAAQVVVVLVREDTKLSEGIRWEIRLADGLHKPLIVHRERASHEWPVDLPEQAIRVTESLTDFAERFDVLALQAGLAIRDSDARTEPLMEQYRLILESAEKLEDRRQSLHAFYVSLNTVLLAATGLVAKQAFDADREGLLLLVPVIALFGVFLCQVWSRQIWSYGQVRRTKFAVLETMERALPAAPFVAEWISLVQRQYESFTDSERRVPAAFRLFHGIGGVVAAALTFLL